jgi:hypothetical protein
MKLVYGRFVDRFERIPADLIAILARICFAALALLIMTLTIQIFVYPNAFDTHGTWAVCLPFLMKYGAGHFSLDYLLLGDRLGSGRMTSQA